MHLLSFLQSTNYTVVCDQIANKSFVLLNASILGNIAKKRLCDLQFGPGASIAWLGGHKQILGGHKNFNTSNPRMWTKKQMFSSRNSTKSWVKTKKRSSSQNMCGFSRIPGWNHKKGLYYKICKKKNSCSRVLGVITSILGVSSLELHSSGT